MRLFAKECKNAVFSILYLVFFAAMSIFFYSQYFEGARWAIGEDKAGGIRSDFTEPAPGAESYGTVYTSNPALIMPQATASLVDEYIMNSYQTYPTGFVRYVRLNETEQAQVAATVEAITGIPIEQAEAAYQAELEENRVWVEDSLTEDGGYYILDTNSIDLSGLFTISIEYSVFLEHMEEIDGLLGGGSAYALDNLTRFSRESKTYEMALEEFNEVRYEDKFTSGWARLFCDYVGIDLALFSVFIPVAFLMRDSRSRSKELVFSRKYSSARVVITRYLSCLAAVFLPVLLFATIATFQLVPYVLSKGFAVAPFAFYFYSFTWLLPTAMVCCSVGFFFTTLTNSPLGIAVQVVWSFLTLTSRNLSGDIEGSFFLRHNTHLERGYIMDNFGLIMRNRVGFTVLALVLLGFSILFYDLQRRGRLDVPQWLRQRFGRRAKANKADSAT